MFITTISSFFLVSCKGNQHKKEDALILSTIDSLPSLIIANAAGQNPEGIEFDKSKNLFFLSAINDNPSIITVDFEGNTKVFSNDNGIKSDKSFGLQVDYKNNRLLACTNYKESRNHVAIYNLDSGFLEQNINLSDLLPEKNRFQANDLVVANNNEIYVTGRLENTIYRIDVDLEPSVLFQRENLGLPNGIVYDSDGYLIVSYYTNDDANLIKIPIENPDLSELITINNLDFRGFDGMILNEKGNLVGVAKNFENPKEGFVFELSSDDKWKTADVVKKIAINRSSTIAQVNSDVYYVINQDWKNKHAKTWTLEKVNLK